MGETLAANQATLQVRVHAARWVPVERLRVFVNGTSVRELPAERKGRYEIPLHFDQDSFVTVEVEGSASGGYAAVYPGFTPLAFTNPIYVDADGDGKWSAPGLASGSTPTP